METNFRRVRASAGELTAPDGSYRICGLLYRNEIRITRSRGSRLMLSHRERFYIRRSPSRPTTEYRGVRERRLLGAAT